jgi:hypothetical protein
VHVGRYDVAPDFSKRGIQHFTKNNLTFPGRVLLSLSAVFC